MRYLAILIMTALLATPVAASETRAVQAMAEVLLELNHFPSEGDKRTLAQVIADDRTTEHERMLAQTIMTLEHRVNQGDRGRLERVMRADDASDSVKTLAEVLLNLNHTPSAADKERLRALSSD